MAPGAGQPIDALAGDDRLGIEADTLEPKLGAVHIVDAERKASKPFAARVENGLETLRRRPLAGRRHQLHRDVRKAERHDLGTSAVCLRSPRWRASEQRPIRLERSVDVAHGDDDVIEPADHSVIVTREAAMAPARASTRRASST